MNARTLPLIALFALTAPNAAFAGSWLETDCEEEDTLCNAAIDAGVFAAVELRLLGELGIDALSIDLDVEDGVVTLTGDVDRQTRKLAPAIAADVDGVHRVRSRLDLTAAEREPNELARSRLADATLHAAVRFEMIDAVGQDALPIVITVADGTVRLSGEVEDEGTARRIVETVTSMERVDRVQDAIEVR